MYNDVSPLEMSHVSKVYAIHVSEPGYTYADKMTVEEKNEMRSLIIELVLATDMKKHFGLVSQTKVRISYDVP